MIIEPIEPITPTAEELQMMVDGITPVKWVSEEELIEMFPNTNEAGSRTGVTHN